MSWSIFNIKGKSALNLCLKMKCSFIYLSNFQVLFSCYHLELILSFHHLVLSYGDVALLLLLLPFCINQIIYFLFKKKKLSGPVGHLAFCLCQLVIIKISNISIFCAAKHFIFQSMIQIYIACKKNTVVIRYSILVVFIHENLVMKKQKLPEAKFC